MGELEDRERERAVTTVAKPNQIVGAPIDAKAWLDKLQGAFAAQLKKSPEMVARFIRMAVNSLYKNPGIQKCDQLSFTMALMDCCELGLFPGAVTAQAYLVPFTDKHRPYPVCTLIPGYQGLVHCAYRHPKVQSIFAAVVREGDEFDVVMGTQRGIHHKPKGEWDAPMSYAYATCEIKGGGKEIFYIVTASEAAAIMERSQSGRRDLERIARGERGTSPWSTDPEAMWMKSAFKRLQKWIPKNWHLMKALEIDARDEDTAGVGRYELQSDFLPKGATDAPALAAPQERIEEAQLKAARSKVQRQKVAVAPSPAPPKEATVPSETPSPVGREPGEEPDAPAGAPEPAPRSFTPVIPQTAAVLKERYAKYASLGGDAGAILDRPIEELGEEEALKLIARFDSRIRYRENNT